MVGWTGAVTGHGRKVARGDLANPAVLGWRVWLPIDWLAGFCAVRMVFDCAGGPGAWGVDSLFVSVAVHAGLWGEQLCCACRQDSGGARASGNQLGTLPLCAASDVRGRA